MSVTFPKWVARDVHDWKALLIERPDGSVDINPATEAVINYMGAIGVTVLTNDTARDAWCRIAVHQALHGSFVTDSKTGQPLFLTREDVLRHIGLETEGEERTFAEFCSEIHRRAQREDSNELPSRIANGGKSMLQYLGLSDDCTSDDLG